MVHVATCIRNLFNMKFEYIYVCNPNLLVDLFLSWILHSKIDLCWNTQSIKSYINHFTFSKLYVSFSLTNLICQIIFLKKSNSFLGVTTNNELTNYNFWRQIRNWTYIGSQANRSFLRVHANSAHKFPSKQFYLYFFKF